MAQQSAHKVRHRVDQLTSGAIRSLGIKSLPRHARFSVPVKLCASSATIVPFAAYTWDKVSSESYIEVSKEKRKSIAYTLAYFESQLCLVSSWVYELPAHSSKLSSYL